MSTIALVLVLVLALLVVAGVVFLRRQGKPVLGPPGTERAHGGSSGTGAGPMTRDRIFFLRFEGAEDESYVGDLVGRHSGATTSAEAIREMALDLVRAAPTATHVYAGPASDVPAGPGTARCGLPEGIVVGFQIVSSQALNTVGDDTDLKAIVAELRAVASFTGDDVRRAELVRAQTSLEADAPPLVAVRVETRPGHQQCAYCRHSFVAHDTRCPGCGARVGQ